jgi:hypothetical protein
VVLIHVNENIIEQRIGLVSRFQYLQSVLVSISAQNNATIQHLRNIFTVRRFDQILLAIDDTERTIRIPLRNIAGSEPPRYKCLAAKKPLGGS